MELDKKWMPAVERAAAQIAENEAACVFVRPDGESVCGTGRGIGPLLAALEHAPEQLRGAVLVDRIVGKAAAMLAVLGGAAGVYGMTMSRAARDYLVSREIPVCWGDLTEQIVNRAGTGMCPMEQTVLELDDPAQALSALRETVRRLRAESAESRG